jgi:2-keto-4-pentenoate hydratase
MTPTARAAGILWTHWREKTQFDELPADCRPGDRADGYAIQAEVARLSGQAVAGWKIAATSVAGQRHINVDGPLAGRLLADRQLPEGAPISLDGNRMRVAEAEFAFRLARSLTKRPDAFTVDEVLAAVASLHPAIEVPDSRYVDFARVGGPQLIADTACASWFVVGAAAPETWRAIDLAAHRVRAYRNDEVAGEGGGFNVLGDPRVALTWIANELRVFSDGLHAGDVVITGTCVTPVAIAPGDRVRMDFGALGRIDAAFSG